MEIKTTTPVKVMYTEVKTTLNEIRHYVITTPMNIMAEAEKLGLKTNRKQHWVYFGANADYNNEFTLQICLEVEVEATSDKFQFQELHSLKHVSTIHNGSWDQLGATYEKFFGQIYQQGIKPTNEVREVYQKVDLDNPDANVTEIQVGVA